MPIAKFAGLESRTPRGAADPELVRRTTYNEEQLPLVLESESDVDLPAWIAAHREELRADLHRHGALLFRSAQRPDFDAVVQAFSGELVEYQGGAAIRSRVGQNTYTASEYPEELDIRLHSEFCYSNDWPMLLFFQCDIEPQDRGQTPIADNRKILAAIPEHIRAQFAERGLLYTCLLYTDRATTAPGSAPTRPTAARRSRPCAPARDAPWSGSATTGCAPRSAASPSPSTR